MHVTSVRRVIMSNWVIKPSYKFDLASISNFLSEDPIYYERHPEAYAFFRHKLEGLDSNLREGAKELYHSGVLLGPGISNLLSVNEYNGEDIDAIVGCLDDKRLKDVPSFADYLGYLPFVKAIILALHSMGVLEYWREHCKRGLEAQCRELSLGAARYAVIDEVSAFLGPQHMITATDIKLYLCHFSAPHGVSVYGSALLSDVRWPLQLQVPIAIHEQMHPPFSRERIEELSDLLWQDDFLREAKGRLPISSGYSQPSSFVEENLVEAAHVYLSHKLGLIPDPWQYFVDHDYASHVLSAIVFYYLQKGWRKQNASYEATINQLVNEGVLQPGQLRCKYLSIYDEVGKSVAHPYTHIYSPNVPSS